MKSIKILSIFLLLILCGTNTKGQELVSNSGGLYADDQLIVSWTVGETIIETFTGESYVLTQGMQQPGLLLIGVEDLDDAFVNIRVYPNPTSDFVKLELGNQYEHLSYRVINTNGKLIEANKINEQSVKISFNKVESGLYLIQLMEGKQTKKIFRIVKN